MASSRIVALGAASALALTSPLAAAHNLAIDFLLGGDDNPNHLSDTFEVDAAYFGRARLQLHHSTDNTGFYYNFEVQASVYQGDDESISDPAFADTTAGNVQLGFRWRPQMDFGPATFDVEVFGRSDDSTYVDPNTAAIARFQLATPAIDEEIGDRFDYTLSGFYTAGNVPISEQAFFVYDLEIFNKTYESYPELELQGFDNLDYQQADLDIGFEKRIWPRTNLITMVGAGVRYYSDRRAPDEDAMIVADTDLEFTFFEIENAIEYDFSDRFQWRFGFGAEQRKDNEDGYLDATHGEVFTRLQYHNPTYVKIVLAGSYRKQQFDDTENPIELSEREFRELEGYSAQLFMERNMYQWTRIPFDVIIGAEINSYENEDYPAYTFDQTRFYFGVRWRPFDLER